MRYAISIQRKNLSVQLVRYVPFTYLGDTEFEQVDTRCSAVHWNNLKLAHWLNSKLKSSLFALCMGMSNLTFSVKLNRWSSLVHPLSSG